MSAARRAATEAIFARARTIEDPAERERFLRERCGHDERLLDELRTLLDAEGATDEVLPWDPFPSWSDRPVCIGDFRLVKLLGRGGMGLVYLAEQQHPRRKVALKLPNPATLSKASFRRFEHEAAILARLDHEGIARVLAAGTYETPTGPAPYFAMELLDGEPIDDFVRRRELSSPEVLRLVAEVCDAVEHVHRNSVIHRDLKPANILVDDDGRARVVDFGVARVAPSEPGWTAQTRSGALIGTLDYMSPEQVDGDGEAVDTRTDVYALGVVLYQLLSGRLPLELGERPLPEALAALRDEEPTPLGALRRTLRGDVETIVAKAMRKDRRERYGSVGALADDLRRHLRHEPVLARPYSPLALAWRFARRHRVLVGVLVLVAASAAGFLGLGREATRQAHAAEFQRRLFDILRTVRAVDALRDEMPGLPMTLGGAPGIESWLAEANALRGQVDACRLAMDALAASAAGPMRRSGRRGVTLEVRERVALMERCVEDLAVAAPLREELERSLERLRARVDGPLEQVFEDPDAAVVHRVLGESLARIAGFFDAGGEVDAMVARLEGVGALRAAADEEGWRDVRAALKDDPRFEGRIPEPCLDLVPLGRDPDSGEFEFWHPATGARPTRDDAGRLRVEPGAGLVLVLLPGGRFTMGIEPEPGAAVDPLTVAHEVELAPFYVSKYEMTQGQWFRVTAKSPSTFRRETFAPDDEAFETHPVTNVSWKEAVLALSSVGLVLPTEAQWEFAARAGTDGGWLGGADVRALAPYANVWDESIVPDSERAAAKPRAPWSDGHLVHAPVGSFAPNGFGLHDVAGNVAELCLDTYQRYDAATLPGSARRVAPVVDGLEICVRGSDFTSEAPACDLRLRQRLSDESALQHVGVRPALRTW